MLRQERWSACALIFLFFVSFAFATDWICPAGNIFCFQRIPNKRSWNESRTDCARIGGDLPGADHLDELDSLSIHGSSSIWTNLCFSKGRLQWLGIRNSHEEKDLQFIDTLLPDLPLVADGQLYCFETGGNPSKTFTLKHSQDAANAVCVSDVKYLVRQTSIPAPRGQILSASAVTEGADIDWGPVGQNRDGFMNIFPPKVTSLKLRCDVKTTGDLNKTAITIRWMRNGGYVTGNFTQGLVSFASEDDLIPWIGFISCEAVYGNEREVVRGGGFHLSMWNTVTARLVSTCLTCRLKSILDSAKIILTQYVEEEIARGSGNSIEFFTEPPVISYHTISFVIHTRNKKIDKFDFKMVQKLGQHFQLSHWAKDRSLFLPKGSSDLVLEIISPCNMALPQDRGNITWTAYLGQTVPSGNFIGEPICLDSRGAIITRSCGLPVLRPIRFQECSAMKPRKEEPKCFHGFEHANDGKCYLKTEASTFATALAKCWAGWPIQPEILEPKSLSYWFQNSRDGIYKIQSTASGFVWLPFRHFNKDTPLLNPPWSWNEVSNRWIHQVNELDIRAENNSDSEELCAAYDLTRNRMVTRSCLKDHLPMICSRPALPPNISSIISNQPDHTGEYFCEQGWITHFLVMDAGMCYRRFTLKEAVDADGAQQFCIKQGGHLAVAPTHNMRIALEQVYGFFNNQSIVDSWIGLRNRGEQPVTFNWVNQTAGVSTSTALNWQPYQEFGSGYGVSTGLTRAWWNWPRETKIWGVLCQKTVSDWQDGIGLQLEKLSVNEYALVFTYDQRNYSPPGKQYSHESKTFWQSDFDVICHFNNYAMHFRFPLDRQYYRVLVPESMGSGRLICEGWLNRPTFRFQSNTVIHRPTYAYDSEQYRPYP